MNDNICGVIVTYNIGSAFLRCYNSVVNQVSKVIIVDNGSDHETVDVLKSLDCNQTNTIVFYNNDNLGIAAAINIGIKYALNNNYDWILTLDHDSEAAPDMVSKQMEIIEQIQNNNEKIGIVAANPFDINIEEYLTDKELFSEQDNYQKVKMVISSGSIINRKAIEDIGLFDEAMFIYYVDTDYCIRLGKNQWNIFLCKSAILYHQEGFREVKKFLGKNWYYHNYNYNAIYYITRNTIYTARKHKIHYIFKHLLKHTVKIFLFDKNRWKLLYFVYKGIIDGILGKTGKMVQK